MGEESLRKTSKEGEKKNELVISSDISNLGVGGNGIAGLLVFGGALAIAGFIAVASSFATNRNKAKTNGKSVLSKPEPKTQQLSLDDNIIKSQHHDDDDDEIENTPNNDGDAVSGCHVTSDMSITQPLILEEKTDFPAYHHHQEIVLSDDSHPESGASSSNEECLASMLDNSGSQEQEDEPQESLQSIQTETKDDDDDDDDNVVLESGVEEEDEETSKATEGTALNFKEEEVKSIQTETKDDDDDGDDVASENGEKEEDEEENSKATEGTAVNSKEEEVLAGELIEEEAEQDLKGEEETTESDIQSQEAQGAHKTDIAASADTDVAVTTNATSNEKANFSLGLNHQPSTITITLLATHNLAYAYAVTSVAFASSSVHPTIFLCP